jgi:hypothetical protein
MYASEEVRQKQRAELKRIAILQREWNALSMAERASIAKESPDLSLFFRRHVGSDDRSEGAMGKVIDLLEAARRRIGDTRAKAKARVAALRTPERGDTKREPRSQK